jgi:hemophore-related protein
MSKRSLIRLTVAVGACGLSLATGVGIASADPIVDSTCTYTQFVSALNAQNPLAAAAFNASPETQSGLRQFLAAPKSQRVEMAQRIRTQPASQPYVPVIEQAFGACNNY